MKTYRFKLYRTQKQKHLHLRVRVAGEIYNHLIALHKRYYSIHDMPLEKRWMRCDCGNDMSRDENAAMNIKNAGMSALGLDTISGALPPCVV